MSSQFRSKSEFAAVLKKHGIVATGSSVKQSYNLKVRVYLEKHNFDPRLSLELAEESAEEFFQAPIEKSRAVPMGDSMALELVLAS